MIYKNFSDAYKKSVDRLGRSYSFFYHQIKMDSSQFNKYYHGHIKNPQPETKTLLNSTVDNCIFEVEGGYKLKPLPTQSGKLQIHRPNVNYSDITTQLDHSFSELHTLFDLYRQSVESNNTSEETKLMQAEMIRDKFKKIAHNL